MKQLVIPTSMATYDEIREEVSSVEMESITIRKQTTRRKNNKATGEIDPVSSGSSKSKNLWRGWKKMIGMVKMVVQDIDEKRIPPPVLTRIQNKPSSSTSRRKK